jgi:hypothetical protein
LTVKPEQRGCGSGIGDDCPFPVSQTLIGLTNLKRHDAYRLPWSGLSPTRRSVSKRRAYRVAPNAIPSEAATANLRCWIVSVDNLLMADQLTSGAARKSESVAILQPTLGHKQINVPATTGEVMVDHISPEFHAEIIVVLFNESNDLRRVTERTRVLLSSASAKHIEAVARFLPKNLVPVLPCRMLRAA